MASDVISLLTADHRQVERLFEQYDLYDDTTAEGTKSALAGDIVRELSIHAAAEEQVLYPAVRQDVPGGAALADEAIAEHQRVKELAAEVERTPAADRGFDGKLRQLMAEVKHHVGEEEGELFPKLRAAMSPERLDDLGRALEGAKRLAPTHPHPGAPATPPGNVVAGMAAGVVDRARDLVDKARQVGKETIDRARGQS